MRMANDIKDMAVSLIYDFSFGKPVKAIRIHLGVYSFQIVDTSCSKGIRGRFWAR